MSNDYLTDYYNQPKVTITVLPKKVESNNGIVYEEFFGEVLGYRIRNGKADILKKDIPAFKQQFPNLIIEEGESSNE